MPERLHLENFGNVHALPILHYRMEFAQLVREAYELLKPDCIAIELPRTLEPQFLRAIARLPELSVLSYQVTGQSVFLLVEPADPLIEGARLALENRIPLHLVDIDLDSYPSHDEQLPDSYAVQRIGLEPFYREVEKLYRDLEPCDEDLRRERGMAHRLQQLSAQHQRVLFICGMSHLQRIRENFGKLLAQPLTRTRREGVAIFNLHPECCHEVLAEYPFLSSLYEMRRSPLPPEPAAGGASLRKSFNAFELILGGKQSIPEEQALLESIQRSAHRIGSEGEMPDRQKIMLRLFLEAARHYRQETGDKVHYWQKRAFFRFARNYALLSQMLLPDLYQMLAAARGCLDDNFAYAFFRLAAHYPWQREQSDLPTMRLSAAELWAGTRRIRFRPREQVRGKGRSGIKMTNRRKEKRPGDWLEGFDDPYICSYPPEDLSIEEYGRNLKRIGARQLSEEASRTEPFSASLLDGIDMRETIRNLHEGKIYVKENKRLKSGVGCVVVVFDEDREDSGYPYCMTWLGEHDQESDMAFYATPPTDNIVGPGISRCEYGGFLLSYPPRRMHDVWQDPDYRGALGKGEVLLMAALDYSLEKDVVYAAAKPPRSYLKQQAARLGKRIIYLPLGSLSPVALKRLRAFHILYGKDKRDIAKDYIW
ncbi:hypothetical protein GPEL0_01f4562 [Geoanaerobacter pelophilus]|uniref:Uncharacterized protein n=1 Tax=Geoanaerobacter pelophilus TaxID=60036 RepID=A0ABQ0MMI3_9BACT|nr:hypothetical protein [Geoanaerobacter pelophilus]GAW68289.1 hypothetical protein GPEL0_01f4562 [Geoanaerobacter pelophilus]